MKGLLLPALLGLAALAAPLADAQANTLYKCSDGDGRTTYTNTKPAAQRCTVLSRETPPAAKAPSTAAGRPRGVAASPSPTDFPRVSMDAQQRRDTDRRHILDQEQMAERRNLEEARRALAEQEVQRTGPDQMRPYRDRIALHERNLEALRREMSNLR
ncbi:hypothetical protein B9N43_12530 [Denitratisoma sp. DHT3]|uniref:DUF4124 domain-containing protein n=1 Tax=Denitratisoma sp. DHT3 TaxID=1981880 RepID=UPI001198576B|nr:DUF4124 domain-containing protein [Denitratisoma sp. DHT3]QDX82968.1 hypothetical protein B9N43_12530 [Denitratisoma sp. DHT3]